MKRLGLVSYKVLTKFLFLFITVSSFIIMVDSCHNPLDNDSQQIWSDRRILKNWQFQIDIFNIGEKEKWFSPQFDRSAWKKVKVPSAWDTYDKSLWGYEGIGWYSTVIPPELINKNKIIRIRFNRVNYYSKVWLNGVLVGENIDGYLPFEIDATDIVSEKNPNVLVIRVDNKPRINWLPASKQIEWVQYGGILQPVEIIQTDSIYISDVWVHAYPRKTGALVDCSIKIKNYKSKVARGNLSVSIPLGGGKIKKEVNVCCVPNAVTSANVQLEMSHAIFWSPASPHLYNLKISLSEAGKIFDTKNYRFGVRSIKTKGRKILLNNVPLRIKGVNRYDIFGRRGPILDAQAIRKDLLKIKYTGANIIRVHYPQSPLTLKLLDEIGLMLIEELPLNWWGQNWWDKEKVTQDTTILKQARSMLKKMIERDKNHPSIIAWSMANECKTETKVGNYVVKELIKEAHRLDTTRLVTFTVHDYVSKHPAFKDADFVSCNIYYGNDSAYHKSLLDSLVRKPSERELKQQVSYFPNKPLVVLEFGACGIYGIHGDVIFSEDWQSEYIKQMWKVIQSVPECSGGILWCWEDYYQRKYFNQTYAVFGPYGVLNVDGLPKKAFKTLCQLYSEK